MGLLACGAGARQPGERLPLGARGSGQVRGVVPLAFGYLSSRLGWSMRVPVESPISLDARARVSLLRMIIKHL